MKRVWPEYLSQFACLGPACPLSCCGGMDIGIDEESLARYRQVKGPVGRRIRKGIDSQEEVFLQTERGCRMLDEDGLCFIWKELGKEAICQTCRDYPRHVEEFPSAREISLGLSCPAAARLILGWEGGFPYREEEDGEEEEYEYEPIEELLYPYLAGRRDILLGSLHSGEEDWQEKAWVLLRMAALLQQGYDEESLEEIEGEKELENLKAELERKKRDVAFDSLCRAGERKRERSQLPLLETFDVLPGAVDVYESLKRILEEEDEKEEAGGQKFWNVLLERWDGPVSLDAAMTNLLGYYVYVYLAGATYTGEILCQARLATFALRWQLRIGQVLWEQKGKADFESFCLVASALSRWIEHDEGVLLYLQEHLSQDEEAVWQ